MPFIAAAEMVAASPAIIVAIPARNEAEEIGLCLRAIANQQGAAADAVVVCLNNCTDASADVVRAEAKSLPFPVLALEIVLPPERAWAGVARGIALNHAAGLAGPDGVLLTTDADGRAAPGWLAANLAAMRDGAEAVAGQADIEPEGARRIPPHLHAADADECIYAALLDELRSLLDPDPADPWPRHDEHSGASIAVTVAAFRRAGGIPAVPLAEDRAFFAALRRVDARIRHARDARVVVSARIEGRAPGGMADTIRRRLTRLDPLLDERLEFLGDAARRASLRARLHEVWRSGAGSSAGLAAIAGQLGLPPAEIAMLMTERHFGTAWAVIEEQSPMLRRRRVPVASLPVQTALARELIGSLRAAGALRPAADPADMRLPDAAASG